MPHPTALDTIARLRAQYPDASFLALGQTVLWDEPVKAAWRALLDQAWPEARLTAGVHDTDYFAKTTALAATDDTYAMVPHNDGATRALWSAAGELSAFLGSEDVPTRAMFERHGIPFNQLAAAHPGGKNKFYEQYTEAWGWQAIVHTGSNPPIAHDIPLAEFGPALLRQLDWGFEKSLAEIGSEFGEAAKAQTDELRGWVTSYLDCCQDSSTLSDLYRDLLPKMCAKLLGGSPAKTDFTQTMELLRFSKQTCHLARFAFVQNFLDPKLRAAACAAYDSAVAGGGMYGLDTFGDGAIPFDIAAPGKGRGTLRITGAEVVVDFRDTPLNIAASRRPETLAALAEVLEAELGENIALVGKAVSLIGMLAGEFIMLLHETASGYTPRTAAMNAKIAAAGGKADMHPIVRIAYPTWDALAAADIATTFLLPEHFARAFGKSEIRAADFGRAWRGTVAAQRDRLAQLGDAHSVRRALALLDDPADNACWPCTGQLYEESLSALKANAEAASEKKIEIRSLREKIQTLTKDRLRLEKAKGEHFRLAIAPLQALRADSPDEAISEQLTEKLKAEHAYREREYTNLIERTRQQIHAARRMIKTLRRSVTAAERSPQAHEARARIAGLTHDVQMARLTRVRDAFAVAESLPHTNARPSAWWLPMVDPSGAWFSAIVDGTQARLEEI